MPILRKENDGWPHFPVKRCRLQPPFTHPHSCLLPSLCPARCSKPRSETAKLLLVVCLTSTTSFWFLYNSPEDMNRCQSLHPSKFQEGTLGMDGTIAAASGDQTLSQHGILRSARARKAVKAGNVRNATWLFSVLTKRGAMKATQSEISSRAFSCNALSKQKRETYLPLTIPKLPA